MGLKLGQVAQPLRAAVTGKASSPPLFEMLALLGRQESLVRLTAYAV
jgi:glutamyl-tRNA synthetase